MFAPRSITTIAPKLAGVRAGATALIISASGAREPACELLRDRGAHRLLLDREPELALAEDRARSRSAPITAALDRLAAEAASRASST